MKEGFGKGICKYFSQGCFKLLLRSGGFNNKWNLEKIGKHLILSTIKHSESENTE